MTKIGVFDSGLGGLSVARQLLSVKPDVSFDYVADIAHVPYGGRPAWQVRDFALGIVRFLLDEGCDAIVMACNMSSAVALPDAVRLYADIPIVGMIRPGAREALSTASTNIAVLATQGTVDSGGYPEALRRINPSCKVTQTACPKFVPLIESGILNGAEVEQAIKEYTSPGLLAGADRYILGCTHYPFLLPELQRICPPNVEFVDPATCAAQEILGACDGQFDNQRRYFVTAPSDTFQQVGSTFLGTQIQDVLLASWSGQRLVAKDNCRTPPVAAVG